MWCLGNCSVPRWVDWPLCDSMTSMVELWGALRSRFFFSILKSICIVFWMIFIWAKYGIFQVNIIWLMLLNLKNNLICSNEDRAQDCSKNELNICLILHSLTFKQVVKKEQNLTFEANFQCQKSSQSFWF